MFIADAAHELRTPLAAMRINVEALQSWVISESQQELLAGIVRSNSRAARLVNQLLLMMHSEAHISTVMSPVPLTTLIQERMAALEPLASGRRIEFEFFADDEIHVAGIRERLVSLIDNLIENAVKYSPEGGRIEVQLQSRDKCAQLRVSDAGLVSRLNCGSACSTDFSAILIRPKAGVDWGLPSSKPLRSNTTAGSI